VKESRSEAEELIQKVQEKKLRELESANGKTNSLWQSQNDYGGVALRDLNSNQVPSKSIVDQAFKIKPVNAADFRSSRQYFTQSNGKSPRTASLGLISKKSPAH